MDTVSINHNLLWILIITTTFSFMIRHKWSAPAAQYTAPQKVSEEEMAEQFLVRKNEILDITTFWKKNAILYSSEGISPSVSSSVLPLNGDGEISESVRQGRF